MKRMAAWLFGCSLATIILISSCSIPMGETPKKKVVLTPPAWVIGTWSDQAGANVFKFSQSDVYYWTPGKKLDFVADFEGTFVSENTSSILYEIQILDPDSVIIYHFQSIDSSTLTFRISYADNSIFTDPIQLTKRLS